MFFEILHANKRSRDQLDNYIAEIADYIMDDNEVDVLTRAMQAIDNNEYEELRNLVRNNPDIIDEQNEEGNTLLHIAAFNNDDRIAQLLLLRYHANPNIYDNDGYGALHVAADLLNPEMLELLLAAGANPNAQNSEQSTPLHMALKSSQGENEESDGDDTLRCVNLLLDAGANPNILADDGYTPLHTAVFHDQISSIRSLLDRGANSTIRNANRQTPRDLALREGNSEAAALLLPIQSSRLNFDSVPSPAA